MLHILRFFSSKCRLFHNAIFFGSCNIHILYTGCAKIFKENSGAKGLKSYRAINVCSVRAGVMSYQWICLLSINSHITIFGLLQSTAYLEGHTAFDSSHFEKELFVRCERAFPLDNEWCRSGIQSPVRVRSFGRRCHGCPRQAVADRAGQVPLWGRECIRNPVSADRIVKVLAVALCPDYIQEGVQVLWGL